jgi:hypothetical protein
VIPHNVGLPARAPHGLPALEHIGLALTSVADLLQRFDESVHPSAVLGDRRTEEAVGPPASEPVRVVIGVDGSPLGGRGRHVDVAVPRESIGSRNAEVVVTRRFSCMIDDVADVDADAG